MRQDSYHPNSKSYGRWSLIRGLHSIQIEVFVAGMDRVSADRGVGYITFFMPSTQVDPSSNTILIPIGLGLVGALLHSEWASGPKN